jgi:salicylate hydroxylase
LNVTVFEQAGESREIGAGISIHPNAALLLQRIGLMRNELIKHGIQRVG